MKQEKTIISDLLLEVDELLKWDKTATYTGLSIDAVNDGHFIARLKKGHNATVASVEKLRAVIEKRTIKRLRGEGGEKK